MTNVDAPIHYARTRATTILLRSSDATYDASTGGFTYSLVAPLVANPDELITVELVNAAIPNSFYNVEVGRSSFDVTETVGGTAASRTITVAEGNYDVNTLRSELLTHLNTGTPVYTVVFNRVVGKYTFSVTGTTAVTFDMTGPMRRSLGFSQATHSFVGSPLTLVSSNVCDLSSNNHSVLVQASFLSSSFITSKEMRTSGIIAVVPISAQNFNFILYQPNEEFFTLLRNNVIDTFTLNLTNQDGRQLDFNGVEWGLSLRFRFEKDPEFEQQSLSLTRRLIKLQGQHLRNTMERLKLDRAHVSNEVDKRRVKVRTSAAALREGA